MTSPGDGSDPLVLVDAMNVMGCRPDGWWRDRAGALERLVSPVGAHAEGVAAEVVVVADGRPGVAGPRPGRHGVVELRYAGSGPGAADDVIAAAVASEHGRCPVRPITVVTSDRGLERRVSPVARVEGARRFRDRVGW